MLRRNKILFALILVILGVSSRLVPHLWNATPIMAICIISGLYLNKKWAIPLAVFTMFLGDIFIGFYEWPLMIVVYSCLGLVVFLGGSKIFTKNFSNIGYLSLASSVIFYLASNWAVWQFTPWYEKSIQGLIQCYVLGLPFLRNALIGDLFYTLALFAVCEMVFKVTFYKSTKLAFKT